MKLKNFILAAFGILTSVFSFAQTDEINSYEKKSMQDSRYQEKKLPDTYIYNFPAKVDLDYYFNAEFIYWQPKMEMLNPGQEVTIEATQDVRKSIIRKFDYTPGFKVGFGVGIPQNNWSVEANYTRIDSSSSQSCEIDNPVVNSHYIIQQWSVYTSNQLYSIKEKWKLNYNIFNLVFENKYYINNYFIVNPGVGIKAGWLDQKFDVDVLGLTNHFYNAKCKLKSWLVGPELKLDTDWVLKYGFELFTDFAVGLLYQRFTDISFKRWQEANFYTQYKRDTGFFRISPEISGQLGLGWGRYLSSNTMHLFLKLGYEFSYYWNQNLIKNLVSTQNNTNTLVSTNVEGSLILQGLTASVRFDF